MTDLKTQFKLIRAKYLIDGNGGAPIKDGAVLLEGTKIRASGTQQDVRVPDGVIPESYDFPESTVLPGLVDVHTHLNYPGDGTHTNDVMSEEDDILLMQSILNARDYLALGVTTIRDNGSKGEEIELLLVKWGYEINPQTEPAINLLEEQNEAMTELALPRLRPELEMPGAASMQPVQAAPAAQPDQISQILAGIAGR